MRYTRSLGALPQLPRSQLLSIACDLLPVRGLFWIAHALYFLVLGYIVTDFALFERWPFSRRFQWV